MTYVNLLHEMLPKEPQNAGANGHSTGATPIEQASNGAALPKSKGGAKRGNRSSYRHGLRSNRSPEGAAYIDCATDVLRRNVEDALVAAKGAVSLSDAFVVNSVTRHESRAQKIAHYLRSDGGKMLSIIERCQLLAQLSDATDRRDRAMRLLNLDVDPKQTIFAQLYNPQPDSNAPAAPGRDATATGDTAPVPTTWNATAARFETQGANPDVHNGNISTEAAL